MMSLLSDTVQLKKRLPSWLLPAFGYCIAGVSLVFVLLRTNFAELLERLSHLNWFWVSLAVALDLLSNVCHAWRWRIILRPAEEVPLWRCIQSVFIGLFANEILPAKAGEAIRIYLLTHWTKVHLPLSITSAVIEAVIDGIWLMVIYVLVTIGISELPHGLERGAWAMGIIVGILSLLFGYLLFHKKHSRVMVSGHKWASQFLHFLDELHKMGEVRSLLAGLGVSFLYLFFQVLSIWALLHADQYDFDIRQAALITVVYRIGTLVPAAPGNIGTLQLFTKYGVQLVGGEAASAAVFGQIYFAFISMVRLLEGGVAILLTGVNLSDIHRTAGQARRAPMRPRHVG